MPTNMTEDLPDLSPALTEEIEKELARLRATPVGLRITALESLLGEATTGLPDFGRALERQLAEAPRSRPGMGVSAAKLNAVRKHVAALAKEGQREVRQKDIQDKLEENSGTISLAVRALAAEGVMEDTGKVEAKSKVWRYTGPELDANGSSRSVRIEPGVGVSEGRRR